MVFTLSVCLPVCLSVALSAIMLDVESSLCQIIFQNFRSKVKIVDHRNVKHVFLVIYRRRLVVESRDWCQNVGEINIDIDNLCIDILVCDL